MNILDTSDGNHQQFLCQWKGNGRAAQPAFAHHAEVDILKRLARGDGSKEIAAELGLAVKTVDNHRQNMLHKTNSRSSAELVNYGIQMGYCNLYVNEYVLSFINWSVWKYLYKPALLAFVYSTTATFCNGQNSLYLLDDPLQ